ncbi:hypothetical protein J6590_088570 [Homalodisca vitripennis]|nr:hypothetical protein J6590_088570 [Homalodisca vitripennis]
MLLLGVTKQRCPVADTTTTALGPTFLCYNSLGFVGSQFMLNKIGLDFVVPTCVVWVKNTDSVVSRSLRRSYELRTKLAARSFAFQSLYCSSSGPDLRFVSCHIG